MKTDVVVHEVWGGQRRIRVYHGGETVVIEVTSNDGAMIVMQQLTPEQAERLAYSLIVQAHDVRVLQKET